MAKRLANIVVHCSDSAWGSAAEIRRWHLENGWRDIGYHFVISNGMTRPDFRVDALDGSVEVGRYLDGDNFISENEIGAHALGYNSDSIGICLIGKTSFTARQLGTLLNVLNDLGRRFDVPVTSILGHYETPDANGKTCPNIDMKHVRYLLGLIK
jgi:hypothetical protein